MGLALKVCETEFIHVLLFFHMNNCQPAFNQLYIVAPNIHRQFNNNSTSVNVKSLLFLPKGLGP